jgi:benzoyl-CoA reductase/2-hydroxyglutaryl-CoA dehydratase subunit BcrC/BadD/HgdB
MARDINRELLELAGFEGAEVDEFMPTWLKTAERLRLKEEDIYFAVDTYIPQNWDIKYRGVRKMIGAYFQEIAQTVDTPTMKENGVKIVYGILPAIANYYYAVKEAGGDNVYIGFPDLLMVNFLNSFFHGAAPFLYEAEKQGFTYGCRHCPLNKMRVAAYSTGTIAPPDIIWSWGFNCDEGPKTDEMLQGLFGNVWKYHVSRVPHDGRFDEQEDEIEERVKFMSEQMKLGVREIEKATGITVTDENLANANKKANAMGFKVEMLTKMCTTSNPPVLGGEALTLFQQALTVPFNTGFTYLEPAIDIMIKEVRQAIKNGEGVMPKDTPTIGYYNLPFCVPWVGKFFRDNGVIGTFSHALSHSKLEMSPGKWPDDPWMSAAEMWSRNGMCRNLAGEAESMIEKVEMFKPDGMVLGFFDFDRWLGAQQKIMAKIVEEKTGVPSYYIEADFWDDRDYSPESLKTRIESVCQIIHTRRALKDAQAE